MRSLLMRCYPARWRARYGDEFEAILEERPLGPFDVADILLGAIDAQLRLRRRGADIPQGRGLSMSLRIGGIAAILSVALWASAFVIGYQTAVDFDPAVQSVLAMTGSLALLVALAGLSAFQARTHPRLAWTAAALFGLGTIAIILGNVGPGVMGLDRDGDGYFQGDGFFWLVVVLGSLALLVGSAFFGIATYRTADLPRAAAILLIGGPVLVLAAVVVAQFDWDLGGALIMAAVICFLVGWFALGVQAIRLDRPASDPRPA